MPLQHASLVLRDWRKRAKQTQRPLHDDNRRIATFFYKPLYIVNYCPNFSPGMFLSHLPHFFSRTEIQVNNQKYSVWLYLLTTAASLNNTWWLDLNQLWISSFASLQEPSKSGIQKSPSGRKRWRRKAELRALLLTVLLFPIREHCTINQVRLHDMLGLNPEFLIMLTE
jgi:hypothetical protein